MNENLKRGLAAGLIANARTAQGDMRYMMARLRAGQDIDRRDLLHTLDLAERTMVCMADLIAPPPAARTVASEICAHG